MEIIPQFHRNLGEEKGNEDDLIEDYQWNSKYTQFGSPLARTRGTLDLSDSPEKLKQLPNSIASTLHDLHWLQTLDLSGNNLQSFDEDFIFSLSKIPNLSSLDLSFNCFFADH
jgi:Leucine-rich repeat (LRR) protein